MAGGCCKTCPTEIANHDAAWRRVLWIALIVNTTMFGVEIIAGMSAYSASLKADSLDFMGDSANYAISLGVSGLSLGWRSKAALLKGMTLVMFGLWILVSTVSMILRGTLPHANTMGAIATLALGANLACALMLWRHREGDANRRSVWICSRNDAISNLAVAAAALGVFGTSAAWPDAAVALVLAALGISGGCQIIRHASRELRCGLTTSMP